MGKRKFINPIIATILFTLLNTGCGKYFENPLKDDITGDDINLLIIDFNFFNTRMTYKILDASDGSDITAPVKISFTGKNGNDIVTFAGEKKSYFETAEGRIELTVDPNLEITENTPMEFAVHLEVEGYNNFSKGIQLHDEGKKTFELKLSKLSDENDTNLQGDINFGNGDTTIVFGRAITPLKSAVIEKNPWEVTFETTIDELMKFRDANGDPLFLSKQDALQAYSNDPDNFINLTISSFTDFQPDIDLINENGIIRSVLFHKLETGKIKRLLVTGREVTSLNGGIITAISDYLEEPAPDYFGFVEFVDNSWTFLGNRLNYDNLNFRYIVAKASNDQLCPTGCTISFSSSAISSFSIDADIFDENGDRIKTVHFKGSFPESFDLENVPPIPATLVFRNNNPSFDSIPPLEVNNLCQGTHQVNVSPAPGYTEYQIVLKAFCPDKPTVAVAPTYSAEIKIKNSDNPWQGIDMTGGIVDILGIPNQEYQLRLLWEDEWEYSTYFTEFDENGNYFHETDAKVSSEIMKDGRIRILIEQEFNQNVCDDLGW